MFGLATSSQQDAILQQLAQLMATTTTLVTAIGETTAAIQRLAALVAPIGTEMTQLRADVASAQPAIDAATDALTAAQPTLDQAIAGLEAVVANQPVAAPSAG